MPSYPSIKVILCDISRLENIFPVAAIFRKFRKSPETIIVMNAKPESLGDEDGFQRALLAEIKHYQREDENPYLEDEDRMPINTGGISLYLINIGPQHNEDMPNLVAFMERHEADIAWWLDTQHDWLPAELHYMNQYREIIKWQRGITPLQLLERYKCHSPRYWKEAEAALMSDNPDILNGNSLAVRYLGASYVASIIGNNLRDSNFYLFYFLASVQELIYSRPNMDVVSLANLFPKAVKETNKAKLKFSDSSIFFRQAKKIGRPVGYVNLGEMPNFINVQDILAYGYKRFPWLCVVKYRIQGQERMEVGSAKLDIVPIIKEHVADKIDNKTLVRLLNAEVVRYPARYARDLSP